MSGLFDIAPLTKSVNVRGAEFSVSGVSAQHLSVIADRYPPLKDALEKKSVSMPMLTQAFLAAAGPVIAAAYGKFNDEKTEAFASSLCLADQIQIMIPILELTLPGVARPLAQGLSRLLSGNSESENSAADQSEASAME